MAVTKKKTKRSQEKTPALKPEFYSKIKREYFDLDYIDQLDEKEKQWLNSFMEEHLNARFNHDGKRILRKKKDKTESYSRNNARNRDVYSITKAKGAFVNVDAQSYIEGLQANAQSEIEDQMIDMIDKKRAILKEE